MNVFLTGGTGFIGQPLTRQLLQRGWKVKALVRNPQSPQSRAIQVLGAELVTGDITDLESMRAPMQGVDLVIHNAAWYELGINAEGKKQMQAINVQGTENVLRLASEHTIPRTIHISSTVAFGETGSQMRDETFKRESPYHSCYEQTKSEAHEIAQQYQQRGLPLIIVCPNAVIGANDHSGYGYFLRLYLNHLLIPFGWAPDRFVSPVHVDDMAEGITLAAEKGQIGETYILSGEPHTQREMIAFWGTKPGGFKVLFWMPALIMRILFATMEPLERLLKLPAFLSRETVDANISLNFSAEKARRELGWTCRSPNEAWTVIIDEEIKLRASRQRRDLVSMLKPL